MKPWVAAIWAATSLAAMAAWFAAGSWLFVWLSGPATAAWLGRRGYWVWTAGWFYWDAWPTPWTKTLYILAFATPGLIIIVGAVTIYSARDSWRLRSRVSILSPRSSTPEIERANTDNHGHAELMSPDTQRALFPATGGKLIGRGGDGGLLFDECFNTSGVSHEIIATRGGKSSRACSMIAYWPNAMVVFDPAAELAHMTWRMLTARGMRVLIMNPDTSPIDRDGVPYQWCHSIAQTNAIGWIDIKNPLAEMHVEAVAALFFEDEGVQKNQSGEFFSGRADTLLTCLIAHVLWDDVGIKDENGTLIAEPLEKNLRSVLDFLSLPVAVLRRMLEFIHEQSPSPLARRYAGQLFDSHEETFTDIYQTNANATRWMAVEVLADMMCGDTFQVTDICYDANIALFVQIPQWACLKFPNLPGVIFGLLMAAKMLNHGHTFPLAIADESWMLKTRTIREIIVNGGKYGMALHMFWPSMGSIDRIWGRDSRKEFFDAAAWVAFGPLGDVESAREVSEACGHFGAMAYSKGDSQSVQAGSSLWSRLSKGNNVNQHPIKVHLFYPHQLMQDLRREIRLILWREKQPAIVGAAPYFDIPELNGLIDPSPYERRRQEPHPWYQLFLRRPAQMLEKAL